MTERSNQGGRFPQQGGGYFGQGSSGERRFGEHGWTFTGDEGRSGMRPEERLKDEVCKALFRKAEVDATNIQVHVKGASVTLLGFVETSLQKDAAQSAVEACLGVDDVVNQINVLNVDTVLTDDDFAASRLEL